jgi:uncharacterized protein (DUF2235 family)
MRSGAYQEENDMIARDAAQGDVQSTARARNLVLCCDGTNNTLTADVEDTNVLLMHGYLRKHADPATTTLYYDPGVGSPDAAPPTDLLDLLKRRASRIAGLASGRGVYENIGEAYAFVMHHWQPGVRIFCFGFSRGAFTARAVVGMINLFGVLRLEHEPMIPTLVRIYFSQPPFGEQAHGRRSWSRMTARMLHLGLARPAKASSEAIQVSEEAAQVTRKELAEQVRRNFTRAAGVYWVGVWDTVESVGLPLLGALDNPATATFHDKPGIRNVRHALALDEHRWPFLPRLYDAPSDSVTDDGRTLKQYWFPGVHCDVGGGYAEREEGSVYDAGRTALGDASLIWMVNEVASELEVPRLGPLPPPGAATYDDLGMPRRRAFPAALHLRHDALHDTPFWALAGMTIRRMQTQRVLTNAQAAAKSQAGVEVDVQAHGPPHLEGPSVWDERRKTWPVLLAAVLAAIAIAVSGWNLTQSSVTRVFDEGPGEACGFAMLQLATVSPWDIDIRRLRPDCARAPAGGLRNAEIWNGVSAAKVGWAMAWDFVFIAALGYLIARLASRVFTWCAGWRRPGQPRPAWLLAMGWLPALACGSDALENILTLLALAMRAIDMPSFAAATLIAVGLLSSLKLVGYLLCAVLFGGGRLLLAVWPTNEVGKIGRDASRGAMPQSARV